MNIHAAIVEAKNTDYVYHFNVMSPEEIQAKGGIKATGSNDLIHHVCTSEYNKKGTAYVSTFVNIYNAYNDAFWQRKKGYIYFIRSPKGGIYIPDNFEEREDIPIDCNWWSSDLEVVFRNKILWDNVLCWIQCNYRKDEIPGDPPIILRSSSKSKKTSKAKKVVFKSDDNLREVKEFVRENGEFEFEPIKCPKKGCTIN